MVVCGIIPGMKANRHILAGICAITISTAFAAIRSVTPTAWNGDPNCWQMRRHHEKMGVVTNGGAKVVFIGDSITHFWETNGKDQLAKYFGDGDMKMLDLGTSADRTEHVLWRLKEGRELDGYEAKCVLLMIGTNNSGHFPFAKEPPSDTILGIREILNAISAKQPKATVVLTAIFPRGRDMNDACRKRNEIVNKEMQKFADGKRVFWCDFNDQFLTYDGILTQELFPDRLHPNGAGYEIWYSAVKPYIDYALSDGKLPAPANRYAPFVRRENVRIDQPISVYPASRIRSEGYGDNDWWLDRLLRNRNEISASGGEIDIVLFGDSITHGWDKSGADSLKELRKSYTVLNAGYSGDRTEQLVWRGMNGELDGYKAKCIMLMIGTNNTWHRKDKPELIAAGIKEILAVIAKKQPQAKVMLLPIFPFGDKADHPNRVNNEAANAIIKGYADGEKVIWVDFNAKFLDEKGDNVKWMPDHCHPNAAGYKEIWLPSVLPYFKKICGK